MIEWNPTQRPSLWTTLSAYLALMKSSIACALDLSKSDGCIWTTSDSAAFAPVSAVHAVRNSYAGRNTYEQIHAVDQHCVKARSAMVC